MKKLSELYPCSYDIDVLGITSDSREVKEGYLFVAVKGFHVDHYDYIDDAVAKGAVAVIADREYEASVPVLVVDDLESTFVSICEKFYNVKAREFKFVGITGTDGKTTTATITRNLLNHFIPTAYLGTNGLYCGDDVYTTNNTTPGVEELYCLLSVVKKHKCKVIVMEVSSEALMHHRVDSILFDVVGYTNITEDHLNIHKTIENYRNCKFSLTKLCKDNGFVFINGDDSNCQMLTVKRKISFGVNKNNDCVISNVKECKDYVEFTVTYNNHNYYFSSPFLGNYNIYNVVLAWLIVGSFGYSYDTILSLVPSLPNVFGRREVFYDKRGFSVILDYAHTENAILNLLKSLKDYNHIIVVTGAAGGREKEKRPRIGKILFEYSDFVVFTMDDPRYEKVSDICLEMIGNEVGDNYIIIESRPNAINYAFSKARNGDVVAVIGKGRDNYMAILDKKLPYNDYDEIQKYLEK